jgi:hypothetical protein
LLRFIRRQLDALELFDSLEVELLDSQWDDPQLEGATGFRILFEPKGKNNKKVLDVHVRMNGDESKE